jgi:hypothetical protein
MVQEKIKAQLQYIEQVNRQENERYGSRDLEELGVESPLTSEAVKEHVTNLNRTLEKKDDTPGVKSKKVISRAVQEIERKLMPKLEKYEEQERMLAGRNSCGRTDPEATVFRMKDGQLLPAYNILFGTQRQFILNYTLHQRKASESDALVAHLEHGHQVLDQYPGLVMGDCAFGSEENYAFLARNRIGNYLKYNTFHFEETKKYRRNQYRKENFSYDGKTDTYQCPEGRTLVLKQNREITTDDGYVMRAKSYQSVDCAQCPVGSLCKRGDGNRSIWINPTLDEHRAEARANLTSDRGIALRRQRGIDVEPSIGDIKYNQGYNRCRLRGQAKVNVEIGLLSIAHNTKKIAALSIN